VPPGQYTVVAWNEAMPSETGIAQVPEGGEIELSFRFERR